MIAPLTAQELLNRAGIALKAYANGAHTSTCPRCSASRKPQHQRLECLGIKIDDRGATWRCNHCGWFGPEKGTGQGNGHDRSFAAIHDYCDEDGALLFQKVRNPPRSKTRFFMRRPSGPGEWINNTKGIDSNILYRLPEVIEAIALGRTILVAEGEKDVDNLWRIGIPATCNAHGAHDPSKNQQPKWKLVHSEQLRGADIVVIPDHDDPGYAHCEATCRLSSGIAKRVRRLVLAAHWPECPIGGDISDWLAAGHSREELDALLLAQAEEYGGGESTKPDHRTTGRIKPGPLVSMEALQPMAFEPIKYVVPGVIVEGLTLLAGKPKIGKSWLLLHAGIAVARGGFTLGDIHCIEGDVLYLALEDNLRRPQSRTTKLLGITQQWPKRMVVCCEWPRLADGGLGAIKDWITCNQHPRLIIIDTLAMVRPPTKLKDQTQYAADYGAVLELRALAAEHKIAVVLVHHLRKADADDALDTVNATLGLTGAVDTVIVLKRDTAGTIVMHGRGRDLIDVEKAMIFDKQSCLWHIAGDAAAVRLTNERTTILQAIEEASEPVGPRDIADATGMRAQNVRFLLGKLLKDGAIERAGYGKYRASA
jgi:hypothetical protein